MKTAKYTLDKDYTIGEVDPRIFGSFVEHLGRVVYDGIYEPGHPSADELGFREDVIEAVKAANVSMVRYPGGNFVSGYRWTDGIGPLAERKPRFDRAWRKVDTNAVGTNEFAHWAKKAGVEFMATVNLGTGTPQEAGEMVEYCNMPGGTYWSDLRREHGYADPHQIKLWCLGNEMDGPWQIGQLSAEDYGKKAREAAKIMKWTDPTIELVACGSCNPDMPTYPDWDRIVLEHLYDQVEFVSLHRYFACDPSSKVMNPNGWVKEDAPYFTANLRDYLRTVISAADYVKTKTHSAKPMYISFDEWNVLPEKWRASGDPEGLFAFSLREVLVYGAVLGTLLQHADRVKAACQSLMINAGGLFSNIKGGGIVIHPVFYPFQLMSRYGRGVALMDRVSGPSVETAQCGPQPALQTAATFNEADGAVNVFISNFDEADDCALRMDLRSFGDLRMLEHVVMAGNLDDTNSPAEPDRLQPARRAAPPVNGGMVDVVIPKASWNMLRFSTG